MSNWLSLLVGQKPGTSNEFDPKDTILKLTDRLENATLLEDRRTSLFALKGLARDYKKLLSEYSLNALSKCLRNDHNDLDIARALLETLAILMSTNEKKQVEMSISLDVSEIFLSNPEHIPILLNCLDEPDFHLRYDTISLLSALHHNFPETVVQSIMSSLNGVSKIVELLLEPRDAIRTEVMLFLGALTKDNADLQKIVAFENAFERIFETISIEHIELISIFDALQLMLNLIKHNPSNQNLFRETGCIPRLVSCMDSFLPAQEDPENKEVPEWVPQQIQNCEVSLDILKALVSSSSANPKLAQTACQQANAIVLLLELGLAAYVPSELQTRALWTLGDVIRGHVQNQSIINQSLIYVPLGDNQVTQSALVLIIKLSVLGKDTSLIVRKAALYVVQSFLYKNPEGKLSISMAALQPPPDEIQSEPSNQHPFSHSTLLLPLLDWQTRDEYRTWFAANILSHAVYRFEKCKEVMSGMYLQRTRRNDEDEDPVSLVQSIAHTLLFVSRSPRAIRSQVALYSLLCCWLWESPNYASEILSDSSLIQLFIEQVSASSCDPLVQGLSGFLLTTLYILDSSPNRTLSSGSIYLIIKERVGFEIFETKLNRLREDKRFLDFGTSTFFDELMIIHFTEHFNQMLREIRISPEDRSKKLVEKEMESGKMALLEQKLEELQSQLNEQAANFEFQRNSMTSTIRDLEQKLYVSRMAFQNIEKEQQDLLLTLAEQDEEINRLRNLHSSFDTNEPKSQPSTMVQLPTGNLIDRSYPYVSPVPLLPEDSTAPNKKELKTDSNLAMVVDL